jgi:hypothetical protein
MAKTLYSMLAMLSLTAMQFSTAQIMPNVTNGFNSSACPVIDSKLLSNGIDKIRSACQTTNQTSKYCNNCFCGIVDVFIDQIQVISEPQVFCNASDYVFTSCQYNFYFELFTQPNITELLLGLDQCTTTDYLNCPSYELYTTWLNQTCFNYTMNVTVPQLPESPQPPTLSPPDFPSESSETSTVANVTVPQPPSPPMSPPDFPSESSETSETSETSTVANVTVPQPPSPPLSPPDFPSESSETSETSETSTVANVTVPQLPESPQPPPPLANLTVPPLPQPPSANITVPQPPSANITVPQPPNVNVTMPQPPTTNTTSSATMLSTAFQTLIGVLFLQMLF